MKESTSISVYMLFVIDTCRFEQYVDYALDVPMYCVYRKKKYIDCTGMTFRVCPSILQSFCYFSLCFCQVTGLFKTCFYYGVYMQDFMGGKLRCLPGELPTLNDWDNHLGTLYPEVHTSSSINYQIISLSGYDFSDAI